MFAKSKQKIVDKLQTAVYYGGMKENNINLDPKSNGQNYTPRNLGLPESNHLAKTDWPEIHRLVTRKRETVPVAFRIDEVAYASLDIIAKQCDISMSTLVNEILNSYITANQNSISPLYSLTDRVLELYLERLNAKLLKMDKKKLEELARDLTDIEFTSGNGINYGYEPSLGQATFGYRPNIEEADDVQFTEFEHCDAGSFCPGDHFIAVPEKKWPIVGTIVASYESKVHQFMPEIKVDCAKIVDIINKNDGKVLITKLIDELKPSPSILARKK